jgi:hypothetical protein
MTLIVDSTPLARKPHATAQRCGATPSCGGPSGGSSRSVRGGSVSQRSRMGISGHQRSPTVQTNRRSWALQFKQLG